jgi:hypothetical protein
MVLGRSHCHAGLHKLTYLLQVYSIYSMFTTFNVKYRGSSENPSYDVSRSENFNPQLYSFLLPSTLLNAKLNPIYN